MKTSTLKSIITKSANKLGTIALTLAISDDSVKESTLQHYSTIERALQALTARLSDAELQFLVDNVSFQWKEINQLSEAQSREFYKRLIAYTKHAHSGNVTEKTLDSLRMHVEKNGKESKWTYQRLQSIFGHTTITQAGYFATFVSLTNSGTKKTPAKGNEITVDWNHPLFRNF